MNYLTSSLLDFLFFLLFFLFFVFLISLQLKESSMNCLPPLNVQRYKTISPFLRIPCTHIMLITINMLNVCSVQYINKINLPCFYYMMSLNCSCCSIFTTYLIQFLSNGYIFSATCRRALEYMYIYLKWDVYNKILTGVSCSILF